MDPTISQVLYEVQRASLAMGGSRELFYARWNQERVLDVAPLTGVFLVAFAVLIAHGAGTS